MKSALYAFIVALLSGCISPPDKPAEPVVDSTMTMEFLGKDYRPEVLLFPEYLLMEEFELSQHGRISDTDLVGAGMRSMLSLTTIRTRFSDVLASNGWEIDKMEISRQSFRLMASLKEETVEIRAVQGGGASQVFLLYKLRPGFEIEFDPELSRAPVEPTRTHGSSRRRR